MTLVARRWLALGLALLAIFVWSWQPPSGPPPGTAAPALTVTTTDGRTFDLASERGHPVVLAFWATWCPACRAEAPALGRLERRLAPRGTSVVALSVDTLPAQRVASEARALGMPSRVALAPADVVARFAVTLLPTTIVVDARGDIVRVWSGAASEEEISSALDAAEREGRS